MSKKPLIGLNTDFVAETHDRPAYSLAAAGYFDQITAAGGIPLMVPPMEDPDDISAVLDQLDGFVMVGGRDLDPRNDGFMLHPTVRSMDPRREHFDRMICQMICDRRMPLFGIGVGMQLLNVTMGGNLFLHLPEDLPKTIQEYPKTVPRWVQDCPMTTKHGSKKAPEEGSKTNRHSPKTVSDRLEAL